MNITCNKCGELKSVVELVSSKGTKIRRICHPCELIRQKEKQKRNWLISPERQKEIKRKSYHKHRDKSLERQKKYREKLRFDVLNYYSEGAMKCRCCDEEENVFLTIDHINGGGTMERKISGGGGHHTYRFIKKNNYPKGYQVLCFNCNNAKHRLGICPHQRKK